MGAAADPGGVAGGNMPASAGHRFVVSAATKRRGKTAMNEVNKRKVHGPDCKANVGLEAVRGEIWIVPENEPPVTRQCALAGVSRATYYARRSRQA